MDKTICFCPCDFLKLFLNLSITCGITDCSVRAAVNKFNTFSHFSPHEKGTKDQVVTLSATMMKAPPISIFKNVL